MKTELKIASEIEDIAKARNQVELCLEVGWKYYEQGFWSPFRRYYREF